MAKHEPDSGPGWVLARWSCWLNGCRVGIMALLWVGGCALAEVGVNDLRIRIGQSAGFSGVAQDFGNGYRAGIWLAFERANQSGRLHGRKLELVTYDDANEPKRAADNTVKLIDDDKVFALIGYVATANLAAAMPIAEKSGVPMFAPMVGTASFRTKYNPLLFHVRASYALELKKITGHLAALGLKDVAVIYQDSPFGRSNLGLFLEIAKSMSLDVSTRVMMDVGVADATLQVAALKNAAPDAVLMIMTGRLAELFLRDFRATVGAVPVYALSIGIPDPAGSAKRLNGKLAGLITASIVPSSHRTRLAIVADYQHDRERFAQSTDSHTVLEGYIAGRVFVEALQRAGRNLTRDGFVKAIEGMGNTQIAGFPVSYGPGDHNGSTFVNLEMYDRDGGWVRQ